MVRGNKKITFIIATVVVISVLRAVIFLYPAHAQLPVRKNSIARMEQNIPLPQSSPILEVHIANNGAILLVGARIVSVSGDTIRVITEWDSGDFTWDVQKNYTTKFFNAKGKKETLADLHIGDIVTVTGTLISGGLEHAVNADFVRE